MPFEVITLEEAKKDLKKMDENQKKNFLLHFRKLVNFTPGKHLKHGLPFFVEKVTKQNRFAFDVNENIIQIVRCFKTHKEYEDWYKSYK